MKMREIMKVTRISTIMVILLFSFALAGTYSGGTGTEEDPYLIANKADLLELGITSGDWDKHYLQSSDIYFTASDFQSGGDFYNSGNGFLPIGHISPYFSGTYNGNNNVISGLVINRSTEQFNGLFGYIKDGDISNLDVIDFRYESHDQCGGLAGHIYKTDITNCSCEGDIISAEDYIGGLVGGTSDTCSIVYCHSMGSISGAYYVGGLVGLINQESHISKCYSGVDVTGTSHYHGGLVGLNYGQVDNSFSYGRVDGKYWSGGVVGCNQADAFVSKCYSLSVTTGIISSWTGGVCGLNSGTVSDCFWDVDVSGLTFSNGGTGKTTAEMKTMSTYTDSNWDFIGESANGSDEIWDIFGTVNDAYPYLPYQNSPEIPTPIVLDYFQAVLKVDAVELTWRTASETENLGFVIERCLKDAGSWECLAQYNEDPSLRGAGTSTGSNTYSYSDHDILNGESYEYRLSDVDYNGNIYRRGLLSVMTECGISKVFPNPFNPSTKLTYSLPGTALTTVVVYDMNGRFVETLVNEYQLKGNYDISWQPGDLSSGVYIVHLNSGDIHQVRKIVYMK